MGAAITACTDFASKVGDKIGRFVDKIDKRLGSAIRVGAAVVGILGPALVRIFSSADKPNKAAFTQPMADTEAAAVLERAGGVTAEAVVERAARAGIAPAAWNVAVAGCSGSGKSTLINALCGERVAPTGVVETTRNRTAYQSPLFNNVVLHDLPGSNTEDHPFETYVMDEHLLAFDVILLVFADRLLQGVGAIVADLVAAGKHVVFVRARADEAITNLRADEAMLADAADEDVLAFLRERTRASIARAAGMQAVEQKLFFVSMRHFSLGTHTLDEANLIRFIAEAFVERVHL